MSLAFILAACSPVGTAHAQSETIQVTITTNPVGNKVIIDDKEFVSPQTVFWIPGSSHVIATISPQGSGPTRYVFGKWSDGGAISHKVATPRTPTTYTADFITQHLLTAVASPATGGSVSANPPSDDGFYSSGTTVRLTAISANGFSFASWSGDLDGTINPQSVIMSAPRSVKANFSSATSVTVATKPDGLTFTVDGKSYSTAQTFSWAPGTNHSIATLSPQGSGATRYLFGRWSDGGAISHDITVPAGSTTYIADFIPQYLLTTAASPAIGGNVSASPPSADGFYNSGTSVQLTATGGSSFSFAGWSGDLSGTSNPQAVVMSAPRSVKANFSATSGITITTNPTGLSVTVDGKSYSTPQTFSWVAGSSHTIETISPQGSGATRYLFGKWSDGGGISHTITAPASSTTFTAEFTTQYLLTTAASPAAGGNVSASPTSADGFYNSGTSVQLTATPASSFSFAGWSGDLSGTSNPLAVVMSAPRSVTANFSSTSGITISTNPTGLSFTVDGKSYSTSQTFSWVAGSSHTIETISLQGSGATRYLFGKWSDGGAISHSITVAEASTTYIADFITQYSLTTMASPAAGGNISANPPSADGFYDSGTSVQLTATGASSFSFAGWNGDLSGTSSPQAVIMSAPRSVTARFLSTSGITVTTDPSGLAFVVDGSTYTSAQVFDWAAGSSHTITAISPQGSGATRYAFSKWSDEGAISHTVTAPSNPATYTASFVTQHLLTTAALPATGGSVRVSPSSADGYYDSGASVMLTATAASGYSFAGWSGDLGGTANSQTLVMSLPRSTTANFAKSAVLPQLSSLDPSFAFEADPSFSLTVHGGNFTSGAQVQWCLPNAICDSRATRVTQFVSTTQLKVAISTADILTPGVAQIRVLMDGIVSADALSFTISPNNAPAELIRVLPDSGSTLGNTKISLIGRNFKRRMVKAEVLGLENLHAIQTIPKLESSTCPFRLGGVCIENLQFVNSTEVTGTTPAGSPGSVDVTLFREDGSQSSVSQAFTYKELPPVSPSPVPDEGKLRNRQRIPFVVDSHEFRTNLGINNLSDSPAAVEILLTNNNGEEVARKTTAVPPKGMTQINDIARFLEGTSQLTGREGYLILESAENFGAWASQLDNLTQDPSMQQARNESAGASRVLIPSSASANQFFTSLIIINNSPTPGQVTIRARRNEGSIEAELVNQPIKASGYLYFENFYERIQRTNVSGPIEIEATGGIKITATARIYTREGTSGYFEGVDVAQASRTVVLPYTLDSPEFRTNLGITNPGANPAMVIVNLVDKDGLVVSSLSATVPPNGMAQLNKINQTLSHAGEAYLRLNSNQPIFGWTSQIDNLTEDVSLVVGKVQSSRTSLLIPSTTNTGLFRSTLVVVNLASTPANVELTSRDNDGNLRATQIQTIAARGFISYGDILTALHLTESYGPLQVNSISGEPIQAVSRVYSNLRTGGYFEAIPTGP